jgi:hypothetical protein
MSESDLTNEQHTRLDGLEIEDRDARIVGYEALPATRYWPDRQAIIIVKRSDGRLQRLRPSGKFTAGPKPVS